MIGGANSGGPERGRRRSSGVRRLGQSATSRGAKGWLSTALVRRVSDQGNLSSAIIENRHGVGVSVGGW